MDFATFCTLANLFQLYFNNNERTMGHLSYLDLWNVGQQVETYGLLKNYTGLFIRNNIQYESLSEGIKINKFYKLGMDGNITLNDKSYHMKSKDYKLSVNDLFFLYRIFETASSYIKYPFQLNPTIFPNVIKDEFFQDINALLKSSFTDFQNVASASDIAADEGLFNDVIFKILDLNNSTFIEMYELMLANKIAKVFNLLKTDEKILKTNQINFKDSVLELITSNEEEYIKYVKKIIFN